MASLADIRRRIVSVKNTRQITRAMKLVAGAKLKRATDAAVAAKPYQQTLTKVLGRVVGSAGDIDHPLLLTPDNEIDIFIVLLTSDRGLCGGFNAQLCRALQNKIDTLKSEGKTVHIYAYGKKGRDYFKSRGYEVAFAKIDLEPSEYSIMAAELTQMLMEKMATESFSETYFASNEYLSVMNQKPSWDKVLPMSIEQTGSVDASHDYIYEPGGDEILGRLLPMALRTQVFQFFLDSQAGEQASRMTAMDSATRNAGDLIDGLTLEFNRARQAAITTELTEIVSGAEAL